jgi:hypothetical protein
MQATIRYAYLVDVALRDGLPTQENRAEGWGFWRMVAPFIAEQDPAGAAAVTAIFDLSKTVAVRISSPLHRHALVASFSEKRGDQLTVSRPFSSLPRRLQAATITTSARPRR